MADEILNALQSAGTGQYAVPGTKKLALSVLEQAVTDLLYIYHTGQMIHVSGITKKTKETKANFAVRKQAEKQRIRQKAFRLDELHRSEPYLFLTYPTKIRDFWCELAGLDADAVAEMVTVHCADQQSLAAFSKRFSGDKFKNCKPF
ncbi:hypothetical protein [Endozoicomonas sp. Mp262]|uniref:hypothetical protein n=1 Tax=Endozoicomonas sp. Mp262 TaxID=2919499 RepID=UPI0021DAFC58